METCEPQRWHFHKNTWKSQFNTGDSKNSSNIISVINIILKNIFLAKFSQFSFTLSISIRLSLYWSKETSQSHWSHFRHEIYHFHHGTMPETLRFIVRPEKGWHVSWCLTKFPGNTKIQIIHTDSKGLLNADSKYQLWWQDIFQAGHAVWWVNKKKQTKK